LWYTVVSLSFASGSFTTNSNAVRNRCILASGLGMEVLTLLALPPEGSDICCIRLLSIWELCFQPSRSVDALVCNLSTLAITLISLQARLPAGEFGDIINQQAVD